MKTYVFSWTVALGVALAGWCCVTSAPAAAPQPSPQAGCQQAGQLDRSIKVSLKYLLYLPKNYAAQPAWPLLLYLHGAGERGDNLEAVKKHGPPKLIAAGQEFPMIVAAPQCPAGRWWQPMELTALLDEIVERYKVDQERSYVTGLSMGGFGTWALAAFAPDRFAAIAPICGGGEPLWARSLAHLPTWIFHGAKDSVVPLVRSEQMREAMKKQGADVRLTVYPEAGHDSWTASYANPELYAWLLQQRRKSKERN